MGSRFLTANIFKHTRCFYFIKSICCATNFPKYAGKGCHRECSRRARSIAFAARINKPPAGGLFLLSVLCNFAEVFCIKATMKYIIQFEIILAISFVGEILNRLIPLPIPASIYGMIILFALLCTGAIKLSAVREAGKFLIFMMPLMFIAPGVGLLDNWDKMKEFLVAIIVISFVSTIAVMAATGHIAQFIMKKRGKEGER